MPPTSASSPTASTADSWPAEQLLPAPGGLCAIHQPNLLPRLSTLAKLFTADYWIVLDDVQFTRRDYQHRARPADLNEPDRRQWLSISTHLPHGRSTLIHQALITEPSRCRRRTARMLHQRYHSSPHWTWLRDAIEPTLDLFAVTDRTAVIAEASRARSYLCGTGGMRYLDTDLFRGSGIHVTPFHPPTDGVWATAREFSALWHLTTMGPEPASSTTRHRTDVPPDEDGPTARWQIAFRLRSLPDTNQTRPPSTSWSAGCAGAGVQRGR